ncbi:hypothetical protein T439DRAFT_328007 [Meredithblackwellia eburnea MCA 4105]
MVPAATDLTTYSQHQQQAFATVAPRLTHSYSSSSLAPELSPSSSATTYSSPSSSGSSYSGLVSPLSSQPSPGIAGPSGLLPSPDIFDTSCLPQPPATSMGFTHEGSWFAEMQNTYLQQHSELLAPTPSSQNRFLSSPSPGPAMRHRSPAPSSYSSSPGPSSPYSRTSTPASSVYSPYDRRASVSSSIADRRGSDAGGPARGRRPSKLSITVPSQYSPAQAAGYRMAHQMGTLPGQQETPLTPASNDDMEKLMAEIGTILGPEVMNSLDAATTPHTPLSAPLQQQQHQLMSPAQPSPTRRSHRSSRSERPRQASLQRRGPPPMPIGGNGTIEMSGVTLSPEDYALFNASELDYRSYPASAPAWQTTFSQHQLQHQGPPPPSAYPYPNYDNYSFGSSPASHYSAAPSVQQVPATPSSMLLSPPGIPVRPSSAPGVPAHEGLGVPLTHNGRRRGSSVDSADIVALNAAAAASSGAYSQGYPSVIQPSHDYGLPPPHLRHPSGYMTPAPQGFQNPPKMPATPRPPRKRGTSAKGTQPKAAMFINYGAADAKKLLSGVAPSGSSKKKAAAAAAREAGEESS